LRDLEGRAVLPGLLLLAACAALQLHETRARESPCI